MKTFLWADGGNGNNLHVLFFILGSYWIGILIGGVGGGIGIAYFRRRWIGYLIAVFGILICVLTTLLLFILKSL